MISVFISWIVHGDDGTWRHVQTTILNFKLRMLVCL